MTKKEIADIVAKRLGLTQREALDIANEIFATMIDSLAKKGRIELRDFGVFQVAKRKAYMARNPRTGEAVNVPARNTVRLKPGRLLRQRIN